MARTPDLDEIARLEEEREFLLQSIRDLDREHSAGDVDPADYDELRQGYVARTAEVMSALDAERGDLERRQTTARPKLGRRLAWLGACAVFAVVAGVLLARASGTRVGDETITGNSDIPGSADERCRTISMSDPEDGVSCYDDILSDAPDKLEALTYQGWALARLDRFDEATERFDRVVALDPTYADVWVFIASVRNSTGDPVGAQAALDTLYTLNPAPIVVSTLKSMGLDREVALAVLQPDVRACWDQTEESSTLLDTMTSEGDLDQDATVDAARALAQAASCFEDLYDAQSADETYLVLRSYTLGLLSSVLGTVDREQAITVMTTAVASATQALDLDPTDPTARLLRATWRFSLADSAGTVDDIDQMGVGAVNPLVAPFLSATEVRSRAAADLELQGSTPTTAAGATTAAPDTAAPTTAAD